MEQQNQIQRRLNAPTLFLITIGSMMGSGWLLGPYYTAKIAGPAALLTWGIGGLLMSFILLTFARLSAAYPEPGCMVRFAEYSHGPLVSFTYSWLAWLSTVCAAPIETMALLQYAHNYAPFLMVETANGEALSWAGIGIAIFLMAILVIINAYGIRLFAKISSTLVIIKTAIPLLVIVLLTQFAFHADNFSTLHGFAPEGLKSIFQALPLGGVVFSFMGFSTTLQLAGEAKNPSRVLPIALISALLFVVCVYTLLQIALIGALPLGALRAGWRHLSFAGAHGPFAGLLAHHHMSWAAMLIYAESMISPLCAALIFTTSVGRTTYAISNNGFFPKSFSHLTNKGVPLNAILFNYVVGLILLLPFPGWHQFVGYVVSLVVMTYGIGPIALIALQDKIHSKPVMSLIAFLGFTVTNLITYWAGLKVVCFVLGATVIGNIIFSYHFFYRQKHEVIPHLAYAWWLIPYLIGLWLIAYLGAFGGLNKIPFGTDFIVITLFSLIIFALGLACAKSAKPILSAQHDLG